MTKEKPDASAKKTRAMREGVSPIKRFDKAKTTKLVDTKTRMSLGQNINLLKTTGSEKMKPQTQEGGQRRERGKKMKIKNDEKLKKRNKWGKKFNG